jgi:heat shock protein beta
LAQAVTKRVLEWTTINEQKPVWLREPESVTQQEYAEFYKQVFRQYEEPAAHSHFKVEGQVEFRALLYVPGEVPFEMMRDMFPDANRPIRLYVKRVFINDNFKELVPRWLSFLRGVVDSEDLPLNVGREILQKSRMLSVIQKRIVRKSIDMIRGLEADTNTTAYDRFWKNFGKYVKVGVIEEEDSRKDLLPLLRLPSTYKGGELTSLKDYVSRMKEDQKFIYYVTGENRAVAEMSPILVRRVTVS